MTKRKDPKDYLKTGAPHKEGFSDEECEALGQRYLKWMKDCEKKAEEGKPLPVHLSEFYSEIEDIPRTYWHTSLSVRPSFTKYYEKGADWMAKIIMKNKDLPTAYGSRFLSLYDRNLKHHERDIIQQKAQADILAKIEYELKKGASPNDDNLDELLESIKKLHNGTQSKAD